MTVVQQLDEGARRVLAAEGFAAKVTALAWTVHAVRSWAVNAGRDGVAESLGSAGRVLEQLGERVGRMAAARGRMRW